MFGRTGAYKKTALQAREYRTAERDIFWLGLDWIEQGLTSPPTQYRLSERQFYRSKDPTNSIKVLKVKLAIYPSSAVATPLLKDSTIVRPKVG